MKRRRETPSLSYCPRDNCAHGVCYQHGTNVKLSLDTFADCESIQQRINNDELQVPKECLVARVSSLNTNSKVQSIAMWLSCSKKDAPGTINSIKDANKAVKEIYGLPIFNICTDGDGTRQQVANHIMPESVPVESPIY